MSAETDRLIDIMAKLRDPSGGCPWDLEQDFASIAPHTIEEAYEVADAIERGDMGHLLEELGDLLFQVVYHARMAAEAGAFAYEDVARQISDKMVSRHPHVFGDAVVADAEAQTRAWEAHKAAERRAKADLPESHGALDGVAAGLPALTRALKLQKRAARVGFDWPDAGGALDKITEEARELSSELEGGDATRIADEVGDLLFSLVNLARKLDVDPEGALRHANAKFERRFRAMENKLRDDGRTVEDSDLETLDQAWESIKVST